MYVKSILWLSKIYKSVIRLYCGDKSMNFFQDVYKFMNYLTFVDIIFFVAIITLLILLVVLVYFIMINKDDVSKDNEISNDTSMDMDNVKEDKPRDLLEIVDSLKMAPVKEIEEEEEGELLDLKSLTKKLEEQKENECVNFTEYEKDQEEKAIISYDELLQKQNKYSINYEKEIKEDDVIIKKVNLNDLVNKEVEDKVSEVRVISYAKEEAFLSALKELNRLLN